MEIEEFSDPREVADAPRSDKFRSRTDGNTRARRRWRTSSSGNDRQKLRLRKVRQETELIPESVSDPQYRFQNFLIPAASGVRDVGSEPPCAINRWDSDYRGESAACETVCRSAGMIPVPLG
jgi:hypothetical protein